MREGCTPKTLHRGICLFDGAGDSADQASATDRRDDDFDAGMLLQNFEAESSLPRDDGIVVEGMNQSQAVGLALLDRFFVGFVVVGAVQHDLGAVGACRGNFGERRGQRHDDAGCDLVASGVVGDALGMIAGGGCDHAVGAFFLVKREQFIQRAALFECAGALLVVELEEDGVIGEAGECFRMRAGRNADVGADSIESGLDIGELDHDGGAVILLHLRTRVGAGIRFRNSCTTKDTNVRDGFD